VVGLVWSNDPESYAGGSVATGRASYVGQVEGDDPDKTVLQVGGLGREDNNLTTVKKFLLLRIIIMDAGRITAVKDRRRVKRWRQKAVDREDWASVIKEAKASEGRRANEKVSKQASKYVSKQVST
jgi:hypothetical protein